MSDPQLRVVDSGPDMVTCTTCSGTGLVNIDVDDNSDDSDPDW